MNKIVKSIGCILLVCALFAIFPLMSNQPGKSKTHLSPTISDNAQTTPGETSSPSDTEPSQPAVTPDETTNPGNGPHTGNNEQVLLPTEKHEHVFTTYTVVKAPSCDSDGEAQYTCHCGATQTEVLPALQHDYRHVETYEATCQHDGYMLYQCVCNKTKKETLPKLDHYYKLDKRQEPTCTAEGYILYVCKCGGAKKETLPKVEHSFQQISTTPATCTKDGSVLYTCHCGKTKTEVIKKVAHSYKYASKIDATCTQEGKVINRCVCGAETYESIAKVAHKYVETSRIAATCTQAGKVTYTCKCGDTKTETLEKVEHSYSVTSTVESTTTVKGHKVYTCKNCPASYIEELELKPPAIYTDMCGPSLINKPLPHDKYQDLAKLIFDSISKKQTQKEAVKTDKISMEGYNTNDVLSWFRDKYRYASILYWYTLYRYDNKPAEMLVWGDEEIWAEMDAVQAEVSRVLKELKIDSTVTQYEATKRINDYICESMYYEYNEDCRDGSVIHSMTGKSGVCHNYAVRFQLLCLGAGIECEYYSSNTMNHAWNKVIFSDGTSYWVDVCWNDAQYKFSDGRVVETSVANGVPEKTVKRIRARYFLIDTETLLQDHTL